MGERMSAERTADVHDFLDQKLGQYSDCNAPYKIQLMAKALLALADHPSTAFDWKYNRVFTIAFGANLPTELEGTTERFERCRQALLDHLSPKSDDEKRQFLEKVLSELHDLDERRRAAPRLIALLDLPLQRPEPELPKGPPTVLTVAYAVEVTVDDHDDRPLVGAALACFDGLEPDGETCVDEAPALDPIPGRQSTKLRLRYDATTKTLTCLMIMKLKRPLIEDELAELRSTWLENFSNGFDEPESWQPPKPPPKGRVDVSVSFSEVISIEQRPAAALKQPAAKKMPAAKKTATPKKAAPKKTPSKKAKSKQVTAKKRNRRG